MKIIASSFILFVLLSACETMTRDEIVTETSMTNRMSREELIELVNKISTPPTTEAEEELIHSWLRIFESNVPHPEASGLIFWPTKYGLPSGPSAEEIVDKALSYKPIQL